MACGKFYQDHQGEPNALENAMVGLGELQVKAGNDEVIKIRLPAASGY